MTSSTETPEAEAVIVNTRIPADQAERLKEVAKQQDLSVSQILRRLIADYLKKQR